MCNEEGAGVLVVGHSATDQVRHESDIFVPKTHADAGLFLFFLRAVELPRAWDLCLVTSVREENVRARRPQCRFQCHAVGRAEPVFCGRWGSEPHDSQAWKRELDSGEDDTRLTEGTPESLDEGKWNEMREQGNACRGEARRVSPPTKRKILARMDMTQSGAEPARSKSMRSLHGP